MLQDFLRSLNESQESAGMWHGWWGFSVDLTEGSCFGGSDHLQIKVRTVSHYQDMQDILTLWWQNNDEKELQYGYQGRNLPHGCKNSDDFVLVPL